MRFNTDGTPDSTFNDDGIIMTNMGIGAGVANAILIQPDDKIVLAGQVLNGATLRWEICIARYLEDGSLDEAWDEDGIVFTGSPDADFTIKALAMQPDKTILAGGFFGTAPSNNLFAVARYHLDGRPDGTFGEEGLLLGSYGAQDNQVNEILIQPDGQIMIAGTSLQGNRDLFAIARLDPDGSFDDTFGEDGVVTPAIDQNDGINAMALQQDGKLIVAGESFNGQRFSIVVARIETGLTTSVVDPVKPDFKATVFPNPASEELHVSFKILQSCLVRIVLIDQDGRIVYEIAVSGRHESEEDTLSFELPHNIQSGMYNLGLISGKSISFVPVVVVLR
jgi:uncharacterized delta-60 repeat protein